MTPAAVAVPGVIASSRRRNAALTYPQEVLADSPSAYWRLGEASGTTAADDTGNGNTGTYVNAPTLGAVSLLTGDVDSAVTFNGTNQDVLLPANIASLPTATSEISLEAWIKTASGGPILSARSGATQILDFYVSAGCLLLQVRGNSGEGLLQLGGGSLINDGVRHHVVATRDASKVWRLYVDGTLDTRGVDAVTTAVTGLTSTCIAKQSDSPEWFAGTVDEVAVYDVALTAGQVAAHYGAGGQEGTSGASDGYSTEVLADAPTAYYRLGETGGIRAIDSSGNAHHAARRNGAGVNDTGLITASADPASTLDGSNDRIDIGEDIATITSAADSISFEAWVKTTVGGMIVGCRDPATDSPAIFFDVSSGKAHILVRNNDRSNLFQFNGATTVTDGNPHHIVITRDGADQKWRVYVDGALDGTSTADAISLISNLAWSAIGCDRTSPSFYIGTVDEVAIYRGIALSLARVQAHYAAGS